MAAPIFSAADFLSAWQRLLPRGRVWPRDSAAVQTQVAAALMQTYARQHARSNELLVDAFPATTDELLPEWESSVGLPDPCAGESPTLQQRRAQVVARLAGQGGQSIAYLTGFAAQLGFTITISQFTPFRLGTQRMGTPLGGPEWAHTWAVNAPVTTVTPFRMGESVMGQPLQAWGNAVLQCEMLALAPAQTIVQFRYS